jgi:hypothetical protein
MEVNEPTITEDGHCVVINGRRWRATDPSIPDKQLTRILMSWRREVHRTKGTETESTARAGAMASPSGRAQR